MVKGAHGVKQPDAEGGLKMAALPTASHVGKTARSVSGNEGTEFFGYFINSLFPGDPFETVGRSFEWVEETISMMVVVRDVEPFAAGIAFTAGVFPVGPDPGNAVVFDQYLEPAVLGAQHTRCLQPPVHSPCPFLCSWKRS
jgi:hypothetical protein